MKKSLIIILLFIFTKSVWSQEQISNLKYEYFLNLNSSINIVSKDTTINGLIYQITKNDSTEYLYFSYKNYKLTSIKLHDSNEKLNLLNIHVFNKDSIQCLFVGLNNTFFWFGKNINNDSVTLIKTIPNQFNHAIYFTQEGLKMIRNDTVQIFSPKSERIVKLPTPEVIPGGYSIFNPAPNYILKQYFDFWNSSLLFPRHIMINGVLSSEITRENIIAQNIMLFQNKAFYIKENEIIQYQVNKNAITDSVIFKGLNLAFIESSKAVCFYKIENNIKKYYRIEDNMILSLPYYGNQVTNFGSEWEDGDLRIKNGFSPFTGIGGNINYSFIVDKRDNSYFEITNISSPQVGGIQLTNSLISAEDNVNDVKRLKLWNPKLDLESLLFIDKSRKNLDIKGYQILKRISTNSYIVQRQNLDIGILENQNFKLLQSIQSEYSIEYLRNNDGKSPDSRQITIGEKKILTSIDNNYLQFFRTDINKERNERINLSNFGKRQLILEDTLISEIFDKKYTVSEIRYNLDNSYFFYGRQFDSLFFYNTKTKLKEIIKVDNKSNQFSISIFYLKNNEIQVLSNSKIYSFLNSKRDVFDLPKYQQLVQTSYDENSNILIYRLQMSQFSHNFIYIRNNELQEFILKENSEVFPKLIGDKLFINKSYDKIMIDIPNAVVKNILNGTSGTYNFLYDYKNISLFSKLVNYGDSYLTISNTSNNRYFNYKLPSNTEFNFRWGQNGMVYYSLSKNGNTQFLSLNLDTFEIKILNEKILRISEDRKVILIQKDNERYIIACDSTRLALNVSNITTEYSGAIPLFSTDIYSKEYFFFANKSGEDMQIFKTPNKNNIHTNLNWALVEKLNPLEFNTIEEYVLTVYPNPINSSKTDIISSKPILRIEIFDLQGRSLHNSDIIYDKDYQNPLYVNNMSAEDVLRLFFYNSNSGTYIIKFTMEDKTIETRKVIKL